MSSVMITLLITGSALCSMGKLFTSKKKPSFHLGNDGFKIDTNIIKKLKLIDY